MGTPQWRSSHRHPTIADYNGTVQWHHVHSPKVRRHPTPTIVHNGTVRWHRAMAPRPLHPAIALVPRPICQSGSSPSPPIGSKNPYSYRYLGNNGIFTTKLNQFSRRISEPSTTYQRQRASLSQTFWTFTWPFRTVSPLGSADPWWFPVASGLGNGFPMFPKNL